MKHSRSGTGVALHKLIWAVSVMLMTSSSNAQQNTLDSLQQLYHHSESKESKIIYQSQMAFYLSSSDPDSAIALASKALHQSRQLKFRKGIATCQNTIGWAYSQKGDQTAAVQYIDSAIVIYKNLKDDESIFTGYFNLSSIFIRQENYNEALKYLLKSLELIPKYPNLPQVSGIYKNLGIVYRELKEYDHAIEYFQKAIDINLKNKNRELAAAIKISLGILYYQLNNDSAAIRQYHESFALYSKEKSIYGMSIARENEGDVYFNRGNYARALALYREAQDGYKKMNSPSDLAYISMNIAKVYTAQSDFAGAIEQLKFSLAESEKTGAKNYEMNVYEQLSQTYEKQGNAAKALQSFKKYQTLKDSLQSIERMNELSRLRTEFETEQKDQQIALLNADKEVQQAKNLRNLILAVSAVITALFLGIVIIIRNKLFKKEKLIINQEKQIAEQQRQETEQKFLRSQMNPHFIFNCMNTIDSFVLQNKKEEASALIQKFSKLSRQVLEHTSLREISIIEDLNMVQVYLQIEQTRHKGTFDFRIKMNDNIGNCRIAPMMIQPFVENAVVHGVKNRKDGGGFIKVIAEPENDRIKFSVVDNGVGRKMAGLINSNQRERHRSKALEITRARLAFMHHNNHTEDYIKYTDIEDGEGGTKIELWIPRLNPEY